MRQMALTAIGIALLPETAVQEELHREQLVRLNWMGPEMLVFTQVLYHKNKWMSPALKAIIDLMHEVDF